LQDALEGYAKKWNEKTATFSEQPDKTWHSHFADAFGGMCLVYSPDVVSGMPGQTMALDKWDEFGAVGNNDTMADGYDELNYNPYLKNQVVPDGHLRIGIPAKQIREQAMAKKRRARFFHGVDTDAAGHVIITGKQEENGEKDV